MMIMDAGRLESLNRVMAGKEKEMFDLGKVFRNMEWKRLMRPVPMMVTVIALAVIAALSASAKMGGINSITGAVSRVVRTKATTAQAPPPTTVQVNSAVVAQGEALFITILPQGGFDPAEVTRAGGEFRLCLNKRPRADDLVVRLKKQSGELVKEISLPKDSIDWSEMVNLPAGTYALTEANHAGWVCHITIQ